MLKLLLILSFASIPKNDIHLALQQPLKERLDYFSGKESHLKSLVQNKKNNFKLRWMAYSTLVSIQPNKKNLEMGLKSYEWFLKDLGLKLALQYSPKLALKWARKHLSDPSLIVRTTSVKTLISLKDKTSVEKLWHELYAEKNFRKNQSLWVRRHIANALVKLVENKDALKWRYRYHKILKDQDARLHGFAIDGLKRIYKNGPRYVKNEPIDIQKNKWMAWLKKQN